MNCADHFSVIILAGGLGTRLRSLVSDRPKVLSSVAGRPFITYLLDQLEHVGVRSVILSTGFLADKMVEVLGHQYGAMTLHHSPETTPMGTGGGLRLAWPLMTAPHVLILNGDSYIDVDLASCLAWYRQRPRAGAMVVRHVEQTDRYGRVILGDEDTVLAFEEKQPGRGPGWINAGVVILEREEIGQIPEGRPYSLEQELFPRLVRHGFYGYRSTGRFIDIGTPESYTEAQLFFAPDAKTWRAE